MSDNSIMLDVALASVVISAVSTVILAISAALLYRQIKSTHDWNRRKTSQELLQNITQGEFQQALSALREAVKEKLHVDMQDRNKNYADLADLLSKEEMRDVTRNLLIVLNTMESIAIYMKNHVVDEDIVYNMSYTFFIDFYYWARPYIYDCRNLEDNEFIAAEYEHYAKAWAERLAADKKKAASAKAQIVKGKPRL